MGEGCVGVMIAAPRRQGLRTNLSTSMMSEWRSSALVICSGLAGITPTPPSPIGRDEAENRDHRTVPKHPENPRKTAGK